MVEWTSTAPTNRNRKSSSHEGEIGQLQSLLDQTCIGVVVSRNEALTELMLECHHRHCRSSAGKWRCRGAGHQSTISSSGYQQLRLALVEDLPRRFKYRSFSDDPDTQGHDDRRGFGHDPISTGSESRSRWCSRSEQSEPWQPSS